MTKGNDALAKLDLTRARNYYEAAYEKACRIHTVYFLRYEPPSLRSETMVKLIAVYLELDDHESVHRCAGAILNLDCDHCWKDKDKCQEHPYFYTRQAFYTAYYGKAVVSQKQGDFRAALKYFEKAWRCDKECVATYYQLQALRQMLGVEHEEQKAD